MKYLAIVRHGSYDPDYNLSPQGVEQMEGLAPKLKEIVDGGSVALLSSHTPRAAQSAAILARELEVECTIHEELHSSAGVDPELDVAIDLIREHAESDVVVVVTHYEYTEEFPLHFGRNVLGVKSLEGASYRACNKGGAWLIDCETSSCTQIRPTS